MAHDRQARMPAVARRRSGIGTPLLVGAALSLAVLAGWSAMSRRRHLRRYADHAMERRGPLSLFTGGDHPRRRQIDRSGTHPLFERRQSVYESY